MKRFTAFTFALLLLTVACNQEPVGNTATKPKELNDPELTISGVPKTVNSGESFDVTISSKSTGAISLTVSQASVAIADKKSETEYRISVMSNEDISVKITVSQEEMKKEGFAAASAKATFKVIGSGLVSVPGPNDAVSGTAVNFVEAEGEVVSPERGLYQGYEIRSDTPPISAADVRAKIKTGHTLWLLEFYLTDYMNGSIYNSELDRMQTYFDAIREGGAKAIVRFAYRDNTADKPEEPEVNIVLKHIEQVKPILQRNEDVIFVLQAGFIGTWGEWYYTSHFSKLSDRKSVADALLDALPTSRQVQLRTPKYKMDMYNFALKDTITAATAHDGSIASRLAGHNDCFVASENDQGTFEGETTREYWKAETRYVIMGGETCDPVPDHDLPAAEQEKYYAFCECSKTLKNLEDYHWTYLHDGYFEGILSRWKKNGCYDEIRSKLGYRLVLKDVHYGTVEAGKPCQVVIRLFNKGYAAPMNPRQAWLVWVTPNGKVEKTMLGADPRTWHTGYNGVVSSFTPSTSKGTLYLELSDPLLPDNPAYSIVLANKDVFDATTGYNKLFEVK